MDNIIDTVKGDSNVIIAGNGNSITIYDKEAIEVLREQNKALRLQLDTALNIIAKLTNSKI